MAPDPRKFMNGPFSLSARNIKCLAFGFSGVASPLVNGPYGIYGWPLWNLWMAPAELMGGPENSKKWLKSHGTKKVGSRSKNEWSKPISLTS